MARKKNTPPNQEATASIKRGFAPMIFDMNLGVSRASCPNEPKGRSGERINTSAILPEWNQFSQIKDAILPFDTNGTDKSRSKIDIQDAVDLVNKAYTSIGIVRNTVDTMAEMTDDKIFLTGGTKKSRDFFYDWFKVIGLDNLKEQYFRERFKSGNIFIYSFDGRYENSKIPIRYVLLNPYNIVTPTDYYFGTREYSKSLTPYEIKSLKERKTEIAKRVYDSLPESTKKQIDETNLIIGTNQNVYFPLKNDNLLVSFYKKQDYEPFAIPMVWPVLRDLNMKLEMKKMDAAMMRTVNNVILLVTMGEEGKEYDPQNLEEMRQLLQVESVGRVLVSDNTTKAGFVLPDLKKVLGKEKYEVINQDIKEAMMSILGLEGTYSGLSIKIKVFINKIQEDRTHFLTDILIPEMEKIGKIKGFRTIPTPNFINIDFENKNDARRIAIRLCELGALTPEQLIEVFDTGDYPTPEELGGAQEKFVEERKEGKWNPIVGGTPMIPSAAEQERIGLQKQSLKLQEKQVNNQIKTSKLSSQTSQTGGDDENKTPGSAGRPQGATSTAEKYSTISQSALMETFSGYEVFQNSITDFYKESLGTSELNGTQIDNVRHILESVASSCPQEEWVRTAMECVKNPSRLFELEQIEEIDEVMAHFDGISHKDATLIYHSKL